MRGSQPLMWPPPQLAEAAAAAGGAPEGAHWPQQRLQPLPQLAGAGEGTRPGWQEHVPRGGFWQAVEGEQHELWQLGPPQTAGEARKAVHQ